MDLEREILEQPRRPLRREEYERLIELGVFGEDERIELLYGHLVMMSPIGPRHVVAVRKLTMLLAPALLGVAEVQVQSPVAISNLSEPEPDVAVIRQGVPGIPGPADLLLVIEVADSSLGANRKFSAALCAEAGVADFWIVNLVDDLIEVYRAPSGREYTTITTHRPGETVQPLAFPSLDVRVADVIPPR